MGYLCPSKLLPGCFCNGGERSTEVDCCICCKGRAVSGGSTVGWIDAWFFLCGISGQNIFSSACMAAKFFPQQVVVECAGSGVVAQLLDPGLSKLCHPGDW